MVEIIFTSHGSLGVDRIEALGALGDAGNPSPSGEAKVRRLLLPPKGGRRRE
jgi:hypothetical protein